MKPRANRSSTSRPAAAKATAAEAGGQSAPQLVRIEKPVYGGSFLARVEGKAVFVPMALPGEEARIRLHEEKRGYAIGEAEEIVVASAERVSPACPHFGACGGCHYQHAGYEAQLEMKRAVLRETMERAGVVVPGEISVLANAPWRYRNRIRLAFDAAGRAGYRGRRSHAVIPVRECPIAAPLLIEAALAFPEVLRRAAPALRPTEVTLFCDAAENALLASVISASAGKTHFDELAQAWHDCVPALRGVEWMVEGSRGQPSRTVARWGEGSLFYSAAGFGYRVDQGAFFQVNRWLVDALVERVTAGRQGELAWDLFAGVGLFARQLTRNFRRVVAVESAPAATRALAANLKGSSGVPVRSATLEFLRAQSRTSGLQTPNLIVVDPPRTGLGAETCALIAKAAAPVVVYVSCDPATLSRDLRALAGSGYAVESITVVDLFPQTIHLETLVELRHA